MVNQQRTNGAFNGSFLCLNLGTNTLEVGNSFPNQTPSESFHQTPADTTQNPTNPNEINNGFEDVSSSAAEGSISTSETSRSKRGSGEEEDPDWVPEKKARRYSDSASRTAKPKPAHSVSSNPPQISLGGLSGMLNSSSGPPPPHLMSLLGLFGWKVLLQPGKSEYVYVSPVGLPYYSLPKAFETFLQGTSKYSGKASVLSRHLENSSLGGSLVQRAAVSSSYLGAGRENGANVTTKKQRGRRKKNSNFFKNIGPIKDFEEQLQQKGDPLKENEKKSLQKTERFGRKEANQASSLCMVSGRTKGHAEDRRLSNDELNLAACSASLANKDSFCNRISGVRRSRMTGGHGPLDNKMNVLSGSGVCVDKSKGEQVPTSHTENLMKETPKSCKIGKDLNNEVINSDFSTLGVMRNGQSSKRSVVKGRRSVGLRRSTRLNKNNDVLDRNVDSEKQRETSFLVNAKSVTRTNVRKEDASSEKSDCSNSDESSQDETQRSESGIALYSSESNDNNMHGCGTTRIRRSTRINGKHVPVDDDSDVEVGFEDYFLYPAELGVNTLEKKARENTMISYFETDENKGENAASDDMLKQYNMNSSCQKSRFVKSSTSGKEKGVEVTVSEKGFRSFAAEGKLVGGGNFNKKKKKKRRGGCGLTVRRGKDDHQEAIASQAKINILSWLIDSGTLNESERIYYITKNNTENTPGLVTRKGIWCNCCKELVSLSKFVAHAGGKLQQSWDNIFLLSGKTLLLCLKEAWEKEKVEKKVGFQTVAVGDPDPSDDTCGICADGGHLICCDSCPSTFHQTCLMLKTLPEGSWYCPYCICTFCKAVVHGSEMPLEAQNLLSCRQCSRKYHKHCAWGNSMHMMGPVPSSFCGKNCQKVAVKLLDMLGITNSTENGFSWTLLKHVDKDSGIMSDQRFSFIMESNVKLSMALSVLNECFVPLIDQRTGVDMICQAVYNCGSNFNRLNYEGFYTLILERDEEIISAASLRLHGTRLAEMPFIGTRPMYRKQGMCRRLLKAVEEILRSLQVEKLVIPAISDMLETWTKSFSFKPLEPSHKEEVKNLSLMVFAETTLLQKSLQKTEAFVEDAVMPVDKGIGCKNLQENCELQRSFGDQINARSNFGRVENKQEAHEPQKSFGDPTSNRTFSGSEINMQERYGSQRSFCQIVTGSQLRSGNNIKENHEVQRSFDQIKTKSDLVDKGFHGKNIQESRGQQRSFDDQINTRSHFGIVNNIQERHDLERPYGASYGKNIQDSYELQRSFANEIYTRSHFESENNIQESHEVQRYFASTNHLGFSYGENIQDNYEPFKYPGNPGSTRSYVGMRNSIQESEEAQRPIGDKINNSAHFVFQKSIPEGNEMLKSCSDQKNIIDHFGAAPDWLLYECILKGHIDPPSEICRILPPNTSNESISKASSFQHTLKANIDPNSCNGSIPEPSPLQQTFMSNINTGQHNRLARGIPDMLSTMPLKISSGFASKASPSKCLLMPNVNTVSHNFISEASPSQHIDISNVSTVAHNPRTTPSSFQSADVLLDSEPLDQSQSVDESVDEVKKLQLDAIRSSILFDNFLSAIS